jgi:hypothetical protein
MVESAFVPLDDGLEGFALGDRRHEELPHARLLHQGQVEQLHRGHFFTIRSLDHLFFFTLFFVVLIIILI